ncbi:MULTISPECIES: thiamine phosphate synthase [Microvirga]|uniref:thiamine phosphate synthase n=1 Tax=Microvirga TaxID=186650 RepID=UPI001B364099|nr:MULTISPECIES: thiamine phosphate synthase [unclassified Microvirga]MBQ0819384.1 thiamine phosphate synthase [Microvirga sp. HBU67558]
MTLVLDPFYLIVDNADWVRRLMPLGVKLIQLRIKNVSDAAIARQIREAKICCEQHGAQLVVNDHWRLAIAKGCTFVHLGQEDLAGANLPAIRKAGIRLGVSTHDHSELKQALSAAPDYVALGPIFPTDLKQMPWAPQGLRRITEWKQLIGEIPLVAIGGLTIDRIPGVLDAGADSAAVVTDILRHPDPEQQTRRWIALTRIMG